METNLSIPSITETLEQIVERACRSETNIFGYSVWTHHVVFVIKYGKLLAQQLGADTEIVEIAALLHDYANITIPSSSQDHHIQGALAAERILRSLEYPDQKIEAVKDCILSHRGSVLMERRTVEAVCLASADGMAHIDQMPSLLYLAFVQLGMGIDEGTIWVQKKLERSWNKLCPEAQDMMRLEYTAAQNSLSRTPNYHSPM